MKRAGSYLRASLRISKISSISASRLSGGRSRGWMVCLSDWRLRRLASSERYWSIRRTTASTFSRGSPSPPRVSLLHMDGVPSVTGPLGCAGLYRRERPRGQVGRERVWRGKDRSSEGTKPTPFFQEWAMMRRLFSSVSTRLKDEARPGLVGLGGGAGGGGGGAGG